MQINYAPLQRFFLAGERVTIDSPNFKGLATVKKHLKKNVDIVMDGGQPVRCHPSFLTLVTNPETGRAEVGPIEVPLFVPAPTPGTVVRVKPANVARNPKLAGLWIVGGGQGDRSRLFRLNNTDGAYWRILNADLVKVNATVTEV